MFVLHFFSIPVSIYKFMSYLNFCIGLSVAYRTLDRVIYVFMYTELESELGLDESKHMRCEI